MSRLASATEIRKTILFAVHTRWRGHNRSATFVACFAGALCARCFAGGHWCATNEKKPTLVFLVIHLSQMCSAKRKRVRRPTEQALASQLDTINELHARLDGLEKRYRAVKRQRDQYREQLDHLIEHCQALRRIEILAHESSLDGTTDDSGVMPTNLVMLPTPEALPESPALPEEDEEIDIRRFLV